MANSVLIFDEAQSIPIKCIHLFNSAMNFINKVCKSTILLCTATQPPYEEALRRLNFSDNPSLTDYIEPPKRYEIKNELRACGYTYPELADFVTKKLQKATLVILNTKKAVRLLYQELSKRNISAIHLSNSMCPATFMTNRRNNQMFGRRKAGFMHIQSVNRRPALIFHLTVSSAIWQVLIVFIKRQADVIVTVNPTVRMYT